MAYTAKEWNCGDKISVNALNHIEQGVADAQNGYECNSSEGTVIFDGNVTIEYDSQGDYYSGSISYNEFIDFDLLKVEFDGSEYWCYKQAGAVNNENFYGDKNFAMRPFNIVSYQDSVSTTNNINADGPGTVSLKLTGYNVDISDMTPCFRTAVREAAQNNGCVYAVSDFLNFNGEDSVSIPYIEPAVYGVHAAVTVSQGQYATINIAMRNPLPTNGLLGTAISAITHNQGNGHLPMITNIYRNAINNEYVVEVYAHDGALNIAANSIEITAYAIYFSSIVTRCVISGDCCSQGGLQ